ncbi:WhiB family transcriptional regulator [Rhodococcus sp. NPDC059968]|uniref:WhiB family transcriptional regulator n=1 Tax=Rhodococcus sp. NPDC059968 TaxID=3347017 RepID=UPI00366ECDA5
MFFSPDGERGHARDRREARARQICQPCPVLAQCRDHALAAGEPYGVWGGTTEADRRNHTRRLRRGELRPLGSLHPRSVAGGSADATVRIDSSAVDRSHTGGASRGRPTRAVTPIRKPVPTAGPSEITFESSPPTGVSVALRR